MGERLNLPVGRIRLLPLTIDCSRHTQTPERMLGSPPTVGYFARIDPAKGLDLLVEAVVLLQTEFPAIRLQAGGYLGASQRSYLERVRERAAPLGDRFEYLGSPESLPEKIAFLQGLDVFSVPTRYHEPKGIFLLEAWANSLPVVQPAHGAFPELVRSTGGGLLVTPDDPAALAEGLAQVLRDPEIRESLATAGAANVRRLHDLPSLAAATTALWST
jgi:glycosyltransferase involved in cell wall biosynthesis